MLIGLHNKLTKDTVTGQSIKQRNWKADPLLEETATLEPNDYDGAWANLDTNRGHQAPLASFKGTACWKETNYLSNITPQKEDLNQGPWADLEDKIRALAKTQDVYVITGTLYGREMPKLPGADEPHKIPSGYFKVILVQQGWY